MNETKQCPFCGETIMAVAKKCRYCGEMLNDSSLSNNIVPPPLPSAIKQTHNDQSGVYSNMLYEEISGEIQITGPTNKSITELNIPETINGLPVTIIRHNAFEYCPNLKDVTFPETLTEIGEEAFIGCANISALTIPPNIISIGDNAFKECGLKCSQYPLQEAARMGFVLSIREEIMEEDVQKIIPHFLDGEYYLNSLHHVNVHYRGLWMQRNDWCMCLTNKRLIFHWYIFWMETMKIVPLEDIQNIDCKKGMVFSNLMYIYTKSGKIKIEGRGWDAMSSFMREIQEAIQRRKDEIKG